MAKLYLCSHIQLVVFLNPVQQKLLINAFHLQLLIKLFLASFSSWPGPSIISVYEKMRTFGEIQDQSIYSSRNKRRRKKKNFINVGKQQGVGLPHTYSYYTRQSGILPGVVVIGQGQLLSGSYPFPTYCICRFTNYLLYSSSFNLSCYQDQ